MSKKEAKGLEGVRGREGGKISIGVLGKRHNSFKNGDFNAEDAEGAKEIKILGGVIPGRATYHVIAPWERRRKR